MKLPQVEDHFQLKTYGMQHKVALGRLNFTLKFGEWPSPVQRLSMELHEVGLKRSDVFEKIADAFRDPTAGVFIDASVLINFYEMSAAVRDELLDILDRQLGDRFFVPIWAAQETWRWAEHRAPDFPLRDAAAKIKQSLSAYLKAARRYIDEDSFKTKGAFAPSDFITQFSELEEAAHKLIDAVNGQRRPEQTSIKLFPFINKRLLKTNLNKIFEVVRSEGAVRFDAGIPPGVGDSEKPENRYGDLIIWKEIFEFSAESKIERIVYLTRDVEKRDAVYKPRWFKDDHGRPQDNDGTLCLVAPLLAHEAQVHYGIKEVHVLSMLGLAHLLSHLGISAPRLSAALQIQDVNSEPKDTVLNIEDDPDSLDEGGSKTPVVKVENEPLRFATLDLTRPLSDEPIDQLIRQLQSGRWDSQNQAIFELENRLRSASRQQLILIGKAACGAANNQAVQPFKFLKDTFEQNSSPISIRQHIALGVLAEIYLAEDGTPQKPRSSSAVTDIVFAAGKDQNLVPAYNIIMERLQPLSRSYLCLPTDPIERLNIGLTTIGNGVPQELSSVLFGDVELVQSGAPKRRRLLVTPGTPINVAEIRKLVGTEFVVPVDRLVCNEHDDTMLVIPEDTGFISWGPGSGRDLR